MTRRKRPADTCAYFRLENLELKEAIPHKITMHVHAERVEKERLLAENEVSMSHSLTMLHSLTPSSLSPLHVALSDPFLSRRVKNFI